MYCYDFLEVKVSTLKLQGVREKDYDDVPYADNFTPYNIHRDFLGYIIVRLKAQNEAEKKDNGFKRRSPRYTMVETFTNENKEVVHVYSLVQYVAECDEVRVSELSITPAADRVGKPTSVFNDTGLKTDIDFFADR